MNWELLRNFPVARYAVAIAALDTLRLPRFKGSTFRGAFGEALRHTTCTMGFIPCGTCVLQTACPYPYIFETAVLRGNSRTEVPRPFVLRPPMHAQTLFQPGEVLPLELMLFGRGVDYLPYFVMALRRAGERGIGAGRGRFRLQAVDLLGPGTAQPLYDPESGRLEIPPRHQLSVPLPEQPPAGNRLAVHLLTPTRLKADRKLQSSAPFPLLVRALLRRVSALVAVHTGQSLDIDFSAALAAAEAVQTAADGTRWCDWERYSARQDVRMALGGLVGRVTYTGPWQPFWPLLALGSQVHVGKNCSFGLGQYSLAVEATANA